MLASARLLRSTALAPVGNCLLRCRYLFKPLPAAANPLIYRSPAARRRWEAGDGGPLAVGWAATDGIMAPPIDTYWTSTAGAPGLGGMACTCAVC